MWIKTKSQHKINLLSTTTFQTSPYEKHVTKNGKLEQEMFINYNLGFVYCYNVHCYNVQVSSGIGVETLSVIFIYFIRNRSICAWLFIIWLLQHWFTGHFWVWCWFFSGHGGTILIIWELSAQNIGKISLFNMLWQKW